jgi:hypothetical protein
MSARATRPSPRSPAATETPGDGIVQQVLAERRDLMVANERLRLELEDLRRAGIREDPRLHVLELVNRALREELAGVRDELAWFQAAIERLVEEIERASP